MSETIYGFNARTIDGRTESMATYSGNVVLIVNVASKCGFTPQYEGLEQLWRKYGDQGLSILGFPCNQFMGQEPGSEEEISTFCKTTYDVTFPMFSKIEVNGDNTHPLFVFLKSSLPGLMGTEGVKWNFTKFLVDRTGKPIERFAPNAKPSDLEAPIEALLKG